MKLPIISEQVDAPRPLADSTRMTAFIATL
jgi:hypothetical protein